MSSSDKKIRLAAIGVGNRTKKYLQYVSAHPESVSLAALVESDPERLEEAGLAYGLAEDRCFSSAEDFFRVKRDIDAVIIGTPDDLHYAQSMAAIAKGYHILLEKPIARTLAECEDIAKAAQAAGVKVGVCYVLRYHPYYLKIKEILDSGELGPVLSLRHSINIGIDRMTHTYVRGPWSREEEAVPIFLSKCCHDVDIILWLTGAEVEELSSFGSLQWFRGENAPQGSSGRCITCSVEKTCPFSAVDLYRRRMEWTDNFTVPKGHSKAEVVAQELKEGRFGRCVYRCENDVPDNQIVAMKAASGLTVNLSMVSLTREDGRIMRINCAFGEVVADGNKIEVVRFASNKKEIFDFTSVNSLPLHGNADLEIVEDFIESLREPSRELRSPINSALISHKLCFRAEESRKEGRIVRLGK